MRGILFKFSFTNALHAVLSHRDKGIYPGGIPYTESPD